jgi:hypothetical protein
MDPVGKNLELLQVVSDPAFRISGLTNKMLGHGLAVTKFASGRIDEQLS